MAEDWAIDVRKYAPDADAAAIAGIVRHCGIALRSRDASLVAFSDPAETDVVRESFLKRKLGLTDPDSALDAAIAKVGERMKADHTKNRVTVYYLLAEAYGKLGLFGGTAGAAPDLLATGAPPAAPPPVVPLAAMAAAPLAAAPPRPIRASGGGLTWALLGLLLLIGLLVARIVGHHHAAPAPAPAPAPVAAAPVVPDGAGIVTSEVDGRPVVSVYFDTAKSDIDPGFGVQTASLRDWLAAHPGNHLQVSGFNDPRGDAAFNAQLSKTRAFAVRDALIKLGVPATDLDLVKPVDTTDDNGSYAHARRVDVTAVDGPVVGHDAAPATAEAAPARP